MTVTLMGRTGHDIRVNAHMRSTCRLGGKPKQRKEEERGGFSQRSQKRTQGRRPACRRTITSPETVWWGRTIVAARNTQVLGEKSRREGCRCLKPKTVGGEGVA